MQALDIPSVSAPAFKMAMTPSNIQAGFDVTGINPYNRNRIPDEEFLPSSVTDRPDPTMVSGGLPIVTQQGQSPIDPGYVISILGKLWLAMSCIIIVSVI